MEQKSFVLTNGGMNRDLSVSKAGKSSVFENRNIRVESRENDTLLSITNERGTKEVEGLTFAGTLVGWNVLNQYLILFTAATRVEDEQEINVSRIYRVEYTDSSFKSILIFEEDLGFSPEHPIESIVDYETEAIQKIYWVDGINVLRFLNFSDAYLTAHLDSGSLYDNPVFSFHDDITWFDSNRASSILPDCVITKSNTSANPRPNGNTQYFLTYFNKQGQQTGIVYSSPVIYLSPVDRGGAADETNNNAIKLSFSGLDTKYEYVRLYQIIRTTENVVTAAYLVAEADIINGEAVLVDDGTNLGAVDYSSFLYLGGQEVIAGTMAQKDNVMFLGNIKSIGKSGTGDIDTAIRETCFYINGPEDKQQYNRDWESKVVEFVLTDKIDTSSEDCNIPNVYASGYYPYKNQLNYTKAQISTFKGGEKYRFGLRFFRANGTSSDAFWIGDKVNYLYPKMNSNQTISRAIAKCTVPQSVIEAAEEAEFVSVQLLVAQATNSDRSVLAQGIVAPTVFNIYNRYKGHTFAQSSWIYRAKNGNYPFAHFEGLESPYSRYAELQCAWTKEDFTPTPLYALDASGSLTPRPENWDGWAYTKMTGTIKYSGSFGSKWSIALHIWYYSDNTGETVTGSFQKSSNGFKSLDTCVEKWLELYEETSFPYNLRLNASQIKGEIMRADSHNPTYNYVCSEDGHQIIQVDPKQIDNNLIFSEYNRQHYFVDESIVTLNSPEIDSFDVNVDRNGGLKFRIVGAACVDGNITDYTIDAETPKFAEKNVLQFDFSKSVVSKNANGLSAWTLYREESTMVDNPVVNFMMYMWHKPGSIPGYTEGTDEYSALRSKVFANQRFAFYTAYNNYKQNEWSVIPEDIRQINDISAGLYDLKYNGKNVNYSSGADDLVQMPGTLQYPILCAKSAPAVDEPLTLIKEKDTNDPVHISYIARPHAVISMRNHLLPYLFGNNPIVYAGDYASWQSDDYLTQKLIYRSVDFSDPNLIYDGYNTTGAFGGYDILEINSSSHKITLRSYTGSVAVNVMVPAQQECSGRVGNHEVFAHVVARQNGSETCMMMKLGDFTVGITKVSASLITTGITSTKVKVEISSAYKLSSVELELVRTGSTDETITSITLDSSEMPQASDGICNSTLFFNRTSVLHYRVDYTIVFDEGEIGGQKIVPDLTGSISLSGLYSNKTNTHSQCVTAIDADYQLISELPDDDMYVDIVSGANAILEKDGANGGFTYEGNYTSEYIKPTALSYSLPNDSIVSNGQCLLIGELYRDYDAESALDPTQDTRYGGISQSAVSNNIFISAGPRKMLSDSQIIPGHAKAILETRAIYDDCATELRDWWIYYAALASDNNPDVNISLAVLNALDPSDMTLADFAGIVVDAINDGEAGITASVDGNVNIVVAHNTAGPSDLTYIRVRRKLRSGVGYTNVAIGEFDSGVAGRKLLIVGNEGDTYFQRYDSIKTLPNGENTANQVVELASVMVESHINLDGRTDKYRGARTLATLDWAKYGLINRVYTQDDNFLTSVDFDESFDLDTYPSSIIWTLPKAANASVDEWTHITLANALALDGDRGACTALRRFKNSIIAFQDKGICEILFNSSTAVSTEQGVPVELANSNKVDGKRYITGQNGCSNKWSIVEGKTGLFFVDNINKALCAITRSDRGYLNTMDISSSKGFSAWFRKRNSLKTWDPVNFYNVISFYDKSHSDLYIVGKSSDGEAGTLTYNESLGEFTTFLDYDKVPMIANIGDKLIGFKTGKLWKLHEGKFNQYFGSNYESSVVYRVTPEPYNDKIWTNIDSRVDFFDAFDKTTGEYQLPEGVSVNHMHEIAADLYAPNETFNSIKVWNEYQETREDTAPKFEKKFRIWRYQIPRALDQTNTRQSMDRIRNPWIYLRFKKLDISRLMVIHDIVVRYFE